MQRGDGSYRRAENCETAVNKGHHNVGRQLMPSKEELCFPWGIVSPPYYMEMLTFKHINFISNISF